MMTVQFYTEGEMNKPALPTANIVSATATDITISEGTITGIWSGKFTYSNTELTGGTVARYRQYDNGTLQFEVTGINRPALTIKDYWDNDDESGLYQYALSGADSITGSSGKDYLTGEGGNDTINASAGDDEIVGGSGNDTINGGEGSDIAAYEGNIQNFSFSVNHGVITVTDTTGTEGRDRLVDIQQLRFNGDLVTLPNALQYIASYGDLISTFKGDADAGMSHFLNQGIKEGRTATFDPMQYIASYPDLIQAYGTDTDAATTHYLQTGFAEGRTPTFDALQYIASYPDLIQAYGLDTDAATAHYVRTGYAEGRTPTFDAMQYIASYGDLIQVYGTNTEGATIQYIQSGFADDRTPSFNALQYIASYGDLIEAFGTDTDAATAHYIQTGFDEDRSATFDASFYLAKYPDLRVAFNADETLATRHYITTGFSQGRIVDSSGDDTLTGSDFADRIDAGGGNDILIGNGGNDNLIGSSGNDFLNGGAENDLLDGGDGLDFLNGGSGSNQLTGGTGLDIFIFDTALTSDSSSVTDFNTVDDQFFLDSRIFTGLEKGSLSGDAFTTSGSASGSASQIIYNSIDNSLSYDHDGTGSTAAIQFATLVGFSGTLTTADFLVI